jgi:predicted PurR-regulated permease PerM
MKSLINIVLGTVSYLILRFVGVDFAGFWAILIGLFNYIPYVGSFIGVFFPVTLAIVQFGALGPVLGLLAALSAAQMTVGNLVEPWLMGTSLNLSPLVILVSLVVWTARWGVAGAILSVPILAILVIVLSAFDGTRPLAVLLSRDGDIAPRRPGDI